VILQGFLSWLGDPAHWQGPDGIPARTVQHLLYCLVSTLAAAVVAVPLGLYVGHTGRGGLVLVGASNAMRAVPTLGMVTTLFLVANGSAASTLAALAVLAIPPILAGTYAGVQGVDRGVVDAASGMGMTGWQRLWQVEVPGALPLLMGGLRNAMLQVVATAAVAAYVGLGGLGRLLLDGYRLHNYSEMLAGALLVALLAVLMDLLLAAVQRLVVPRGLRIATRSGGRGSATRAKPARTPTGEGGEIATLR
jgi:osmoprotectant transport system permease protein